MEKETTIGILTYHSAYNYGSVLQAFATQKSLNALFPTVNFEIINYRMAEQYRYYALFRTNYGARTLLRDITQLPIYYKRMKRVQKFESFIKNKLKCSEELTEPTDVYKMWEKYPVIISGSDQIWNKHSCELHNNDWEHMFPYILRGYNGYKISYASSIGNMTIKELDTIIDDISDFDFVSMREQYGAELIRKKTTKNVTDVLDPTFLLSKSEWESEFNLNRNPKDNYVFYYSLNRNYCESQKILKQVRLFAKKNGCMLYVLTPYMYLYDNVYQNVVNCADMGPIEFLKCIYGARTIITDSFHGTALSINLEKDFITLEISGGRDLRTTALLNKAGISDRLVKNVYDINSISFNTIDYKRVLQVMKPYKRTSIHYLSDSVGDALSSII